MDQDQVTKSTESGVGLKRTCWGVERAAAETAEVEGEGNRNEPKLKRVEETHDPTNDPPRHPSPPRATRRPPPLPGAGSRPLPLSASDDTRDDHPPVPSDSCSSSGSNSSGPSPLLPQFTPACRGAPRRTFLSREWSTVAHEARSARRGAGPRRRSGR